MPTPCGGPLQQWSDDAEGTDPLDPVVEQCQKEIKMAIRIVQVGMGNWGRNWATNVIQRSEDVALVACVALDGEMLVQTQQFLSIPAERCFQTLNTARTPAETADVSLPGRL